MTKLIFVHGINNQGKSSEEIIEEWSRPLNETLDALKLGPISREDIEAPYYGDFLYEKTKGMINLFKDSSIEGWSELEHEIIEEMNVWALHSDLAKEQDLQESRRRLNAQLNETVFVRDNILGKKGVDSTKGNVKSVIHRRSSIGVATFLSNNFPGIDGPVAKLLLRQAAIYLARQNVKNEVNEHVFNQTFKSRPKDKKAVIVSHSLGTVVSYYMINNLIQDYDIQALFTLGSPLGTNYLSKYNPRPADFPNTIETWINCYDKRDFVSLNSPILEANIGFGGVANWTNFNTSKEDRHSITSYLSHDHLAKEIKEQVDKIK